jgi:hypothetical protein
LTLQHPKVNYSLLSTDGLTNRTNESHDKDISKDIQQLLAEQLGKAATNGTDSLQQQTIRVYRTNSILRELRETPKSLYTYIS